MAHQLAEPRAMGDRLTGQWGNPADDYVADFTFRVATHHMNDLG
jgi:hypothetical protein